MHRVSYLTLRQGTKALNARLRRPNSVERDCQGHHRLPRWQSCQRRLPPRTAGCTASRHACLERPPERHVGGCAGVWVQSGGLPRQAPCRGCCLVGSGSLSLTGPRGTLGSLPGKLLLPGSCLFRQAPLAGALVGLPGKLLLPGPWFEYFVLEWSSREPRMVLAVTRQALPRGAATARAQVRDTRVPLF